MTDLPTAAQLAKWRKQLAEWDASLLNMTKFSEPLRQAADACEALLRRVAELEAEMKECKHPMIAADHCRRCGKWVGPQP